MTGLDLVILIVVGAIAGALAGLVMRSSYGLLVDTIIGIFGSILGNMLFAGVTSTAVTFSITSIFIAFIGAVLLFALFRILNVSIPSRRQNNS